MKRYIAVDSGKYATKIAVYNEEKDEIKLGSFRTKISEGNFADDALEKQTLIAEYDGKIYKIGNGATQEAELSTSKSSEIHKICVLTAIAMNVSDNEVDEVCAAVGIPVKEWENVDKRNEYKNYIMPDGEIEIKIMTKSGQEPVKRRFKIVSKHVYPESQGALFVSEVAPFVSGTVGIIDIGNLNINCTSWTGGELDREYNVTDELGGNILINGLSQELTATFSRCDENLVARVLRCPLEKRMLVPNRPNPEIEKKSKEIIDDYLTNHVKAIKRRCDSKHWSLDFMKLVFIGGTSSLLENEIIKVFGSEVYIPKNPEFVNVMGFLRVMCSKHLDKVISLSTDKEDKGKSKEEPKKEG